MSDDRHHNARPGSGPGSSPRPARPDPLEMNARYMRKEEWDRLVENIRAGRLPHLHPADLRRRRVPKRPRTDPVRQPPHPAAVEAGLDEIDCMLVEQRPQPAGSSSPSSCRTTPSPARTTPPHSSSCTKELDDVDWRASSGL